MWTGPSFLPPHSAAFYSPFFQHFYSFFVVGLFCFVHLLATLLCTSIFAQCFLFAGRKGEGAAEARWNRTSELFVWHCLFMCCNWFGEKKGGKSEENGGLGGRRNGWKTGRSKGAWQGSKNFLKRHLTMLQSWAQHLAGPSECHTSAFIQRAVAPKKLPTHIQNQRFSESNYAIRHIYIYFVYKFEQEF